LSTGPFQAYGRPERKSNSNKNPDAEAAGLPEGPVREAVVPRVFVREPGWHVAVKVGSERTFCYFIAPGEGYYHRLADGEIYLHRGDVKICLTCADRHALLQHEPKSLRTPVRGLDVAHPGEAGEVEGEYEVRPTIDRPLSEGAPDADFLP
jgi:hypothetical protein